MNLNILFNMMEANEKPEFFRAAEIDDAYGRFYENYISLIGSREKENDAYEMLVEMMQLERKNAFMLGYRTAIGLTLMPFSG